MLAQTRSAKRGVGFSTNNLFVPADLQALAASTSWFYTWGTGINLSASGVASAYEGLGYDFCPMAWNQNYNDDNIRAFKAAHPNCRYLLAFNEPNLNDQAKLTPAQAAAAWPKLKALAAELDMKLISPAMNNGTLAGYGDPSVWLDEFFAQPGVSIDDVDAIAIHCYQPWSLNWFINNYFTKYGKPVWVTEYCGWTSDFASTTSNDAKAQMEAMVRCIDLLETRPDVARYAWFLGRAEGTNAGDQGGAFKYPYSSLFTSGAEDPAGGVLTDAGLVFANLSSYDDNYYFDAPCLVPAAHYIGMIGSYFEKTTDSQAPPGGVAAPINAYTRKNSGDPDPEFTYNVNFPPTKKYTVDLRLLLTAGNACRVEIYCDNTLMTTYSIGDTGGYWATRPNSNPPEITFPEGRHKIRLVFKNRTPKVRWVRFTEVQATTGSDVLTVAEEDAVVACSLLDMSGRKLRDGKDAASIDLSPYPAGVYILVSRMQGGETKAGKIIRRE
jgi:hypothetical protein